MNVVTVEDSTFDQSERNYSQHKYSRLTKLLPVVAVLLQSWFIFLEVREGISAEDVPEICLLITCIWLIVLYWRASNFNLRSLERKNVLLTEEALVLTEESNRWKKEADDALRSLSNQINDQLIRWNLTTAEKEVALELLKGRSHKEVANIRNSSEKTVRLQAASIYRKANLEGRAQLSAFFLQGLEISNPAQ